ncbi:MAG: hypothetical protein ONB43_27105 [candidate division KSB1 bacterium]|nr:hypothetical protein [candidate division KSB1 bacterium]
MKAYVKPIMVGIISIALFMIVNKIAFQQADVVKTTQETDNEKKHLLEEIDRLKSELNQLKARQNIPTEDIKPVSSGSRKDITIEYYARNFDPQKVESNLKELGVTLDIKTSSSTIPINMIRFGSNISIDDIKLVACRTIDAGLQIKSIALFSSPSGKNASKIQIGGDSRCEGLRAWTCAEIGNRKFE